jgi:hypothetical protein
MMALGFSGFLAAAAEPPLMLFLEPGVHDPGAAKSIAIKVYRNVRTAGTDAVAVLRDCLDDYRSSLPEETMRFQIGLAVKEASDLAFVPEAFRGMR